MNVFILSETNEQLVLFLGTAPTFLIIEIMLTETAGLHESAFSTLIQG